MKPWVNIPALIEQGMTKDEIAARYGVTRNTLQVQCSRNGISLRKGGQQLRRKILLLPEAPLPLTETAVQTLRQTARVMSGMKPVICLRPGALAFTSALGNDPEDALCDVGPN